MPKRLKKPNRIFIGPLDSGLNYDLKLALMRLGYKVTTLNFVDNDFHFKNDIVLDINHKTLPVAIYAVLRNFFRSFSFDVYHFRFGQSLLPWNLDLPIWKIFGKKVVMRFDGDDIRQSRGFQTNKYNRLFIKNSTLPFGRDLKNILRYFWVRLWADKITVSTPDLLQFAPGAEFVPNLVPLAEMGHEQGKKTNKFMIFHAPTDRKIKGTKYIIRAVERLKKERFPVELMIYENRPHEEIAKFYRQADLVIDQLLMGAMSVVSLEGMSFAKPVICYIREDLRHFYPKELPVISANSDNIYEMLKTLITEKNKLVELGKKGARYAKKYHHPDVIAKRWDEIFQSIY